MRFEINKLINKKIVIFIILLSVLINGIYSSNMVKKNNSLETIHYKTGTDRIYDKVSGKITSEKISYIYNEYIRLEKIISEENFSKDFDENTYTGFIFSDRNFFNELYNNIQYCINYSSQCETISKRASENVQLYKIKKNNYLLNYNEKISEIYSGRYISDYYKTTGWDKYFNYQFSNLIVVMLVIFIMCNIFSSEREENMSVILLTSRRGKNRLVLRKIMASVLISTVLSLVFYIEDFLIFFLGLELKGMNNPIYSLQEFQLCPLNINIFEFIVYIFVCKIAGIIVFNTLIILASSLAGNNLMSCVISIIFTVAVIAVNIMKLPADVLCLLSPQLYLKDYNVVRFLDIPVLKVSFNLSFALVIFLFLLISVWFLETKWGKFKRRERV